MVGWFLSTNGVATPIEVPGTMREAIQRELGSAQLGYYLIVPGVDLWHDLEAAAKGEPFNAPAVGLADLLMGPDVSSLPRAHGCIVIASHDEDNEPAEIGGQGLLALRKLFPVIQDIVEKIVEQPADLEKFASEDRKIE